jgi:hypothetical protein
MLTLLTTRTLMVEEIVAPMPFPFADLGSQSLIHESDAVVSADDVNPVIHAIEYGLQPVALCSAPVLEPVIPVLGWLRHCFSPLDHSLGFVQNFSVSFCPYLIHEDTRRIAKAHKATIAAALEDQSFRSPSIFCGSLLDIRYSLVCGG